MLFYLNKKMGVLFFKKFFFINIASVFVLIKGPMLGLDLKLDINYIISLFKSPTKLTFQF